MRVSIIIPALDEADAIAETLALLQDYRRGGHEVIVVDGDSRDATIAVAWPLADRVIVASRGRARQMNAGAAVASGDVLLFLHADSRLPAGAVEQLLQGLHGSGRHWGRFDVAIDGRHPMLRWVARAMNCRSRLTGIATGDQGIFVRRTAFEGIGGFPSQPLMEDIELSKRLKRTSGKALCLGATIITSGRRWEANGAWGTILTMWRLRFDYWRGMDAGTLDARYGKLQSRARR